ncbi:tetratricopeptide repeat protein [Rufibacter latericius]|uniref:Tetratricopeptide repeat protein n=1 Tax=Rufibacter latericius TaxID=2487040 RepID=A0A3M9MBQ4_9BACT|nr:tetratricopeptide repeat protein [Rufibacter latericius]RNI22018.1 hypothetical protein EFB08_23075 [Rufibacter latericius]
MEKANLRKAYGYVCLFLSIWLGSSSLSAAQDTSQIKFPNSGKHQAQQAFLEGVLLLHSFEYEDAAEAFREAQQQDPTFALAYWGEAMTYNHTIWGGPSENSKAVACLKKLGPNAADRLAKAPTEREKGLMRAVEALFMEKGEKKARDRAYLNQMRQLYKHHPSDLEIAAFTSLAYMGVSNPDSAAVLAKQVLDKEPYHPGALHYFIHCHDNAAQAHLALEAAERYPKAAPYAQHALHMPSHIFAALGQWDGVVASNEVSMAAAEDRRKRKNLGVEDRGYHSIWWLEHGYLQQGRYKEALALVEEVEKNAAQSPDKFIRNNLIYMRAHYIIETRDWENELLNRSMKIDDLPLEHQTIALFTDGYAAIQRGDLATARKALTSINAALGKPTNVGNAQEQHSHAMGCAPSAPVAYSIATVLQKELEAMVWFKEGNKAEAEKSLQEAIRNESLRGAFVMPIFIKPAQELRGELLLQMKRPAEAKQAFQAALMLAPNRVLSLEGLALAAQQNGDQKLYASTQATLKSIKKNTEKN